LGSELQVLSKDYSQFEWVLRIGGIDLCDLEQLAFEVELIHNLLLIALLTPVDRRNRIELSDILNHQAVAVLSKWSQQQL
jgi:dTDP-4-dehydrorhamnose reductase